MYEKQQYERMSSASTCQVTLDISGSPIENGDPGNIQGYSTGMLTWATAAEILSCGINAITASHFHTISRFGWEIVTTEPPHRSRELIKIPSASDDPNFRLAVCLLVNLCQIWISS